MTAQIPDVIEIQDARYHLLAEPLETYLRKSGQVDRIERGVSTALRRGYVAIWRVADDRLYLERIDGHPSGPAETPVAGWYRAGGAEADVPSIADLFPESGGDPVFAEWVTGRLRVGGGEVLHYEHQEYRSIFHRELTLHVRDGQVVKTSERSGRTLIGRSVAAKLGVGLALTLSPWLGLNGSDLYALSAILVGITLVYSGAVQLVHLLRGQ